MKSKFAVAAATALMLIAAPTAYADSTSDGVSPDTPDYFGCDYAAGECDIVVEPTTDRCVDTQSSTEAGSFWLYKGSQWYLVRWNWGADPEADAQLRQSASELSALIAAGDSVGAREVCDWDSAPTPDSGGDGSGFNSDPPIENAYPPLPPECQPTADRTAIECTYDYGDRIDVQPAFGCWTLEDGSTLCVDPPEIVSWPGCNYAAGECEIVFDPAADRCVIERGTSATVLIGRAGQFYVIDWPWGTNEELDAALIRNGAEFRDAIATGNVDFVIGACDSGQINGDGSERPLPPNSCPDGTELCIPPMPNLCPDGAELCIPPMPGEVVEDDPSGRADSPATLSGARAQKGAKAKKAKKKSRGKNSKQKKQRR